MMRKGTIKLLVLADDFTGALDTGVQFRAKNMLIRIREQDVFRIFEDIDEEVQVLIVDLETRHLTPMEAYQVVHTVVSMAKKIGVSCIYKKTDSALRGNIGSELSAALDASGEKGLHFVPAFPRMNRKTENGIHYIENVPVDKSVFGVDAFEPVRYSSVEEIIREQSNVQTVLIERGEADPERNGILIYDATTDEDLKEIASRLKEEKKTGLLAGCAGFAAALSDVLGLEQGVVSLPRMQPEFLVVCGSINPITMRQLDVAQEAGFPRVQLEVYQKSTIRWMDEQNGQKILNLWMNMLKDCQSLIIESGDVTDTPISTQGCRATCDNIRTTIAEHIGKILKRLLDMGAESTLMVTGGDTLQAFMQQIHVSELTNVCELMPGVVLTKIMYNGQPYNLISKSGGFGNQDLLLSLRQLIAARAATKS